MTRPISGSFDIDRAKKYLHERFRFVGLVEKFDESLVLMKNELNLANLRLCYGRRNVCPCSKHGKQNLLSDKEIVKKLMKRNELDIELYEYAKTVIFEKYKDRFDGNY